MDGTWEYKKITLDDMMDYIEKNHPEDKKWFKGIALSEAGKYQHLPAVRAFCEKYMPEIIPEHKEVLTGADKLKDW